MTARMRVRTHSMSLPAVLLFWGVATLPLLAQDTLASRIAHTDPSKYVFSPSAHQGPAGGYRRITLLGSRVNSNLESNLLFMNRGELPPNGGIGHHFHHDIEEMFIILDGEAQFTIDGRTAILKGPAAAPCKMGHSHAIWNHTDQPVQWMNFSVARVWGKYDAENLDDDRIGAPVDPKPVFTNMQLKPELLREMPAYRGGKGTARYRRALQPEMFKTNWAYVDHLVLPANASEGLHVHNGVEEIYYVMRGSGRVTVDDESVDIGVGDAIPVRPGEAHAFFSAAAGDIEFMIFGLAMEEDRLDTTELDAGQPRRGGR